MASSRALRSCPLLRILMHRRRRLPSLPWRRCVFSTITAASYPCRHLPAQLPPLLVASPISNDASPLDRRREEVVVVRSVDGGNGGEQIRLWHHVEDTAARVGCHSLYNLKNWEIF